MKGKSLSRVQLLATPWTTACQAPPSMGFSRQEYWSGVPLPSPTMTQRFCQTAESSEVLPKRKLTLFKTEYGKAEVKGTEKQWKFLVVSNQDGSRIIVNSDSSHEIKRRLLLERKAMTNLDSTFKKQRHHFADKHLSSQSYGFSIVINGCESWTIKKAEGQRIAFELWCWWATAHRVAKNLTQLSD